MGIERALAFTEMDGFRADFIRFCAECGCLDPDPKTADVAAAFAWLKLNPDEPETEH